MSRLIKPNKAEWKVLRKLGFLKQTQSIILVSPHLSDEARKAIKTNGSKLSHHYHHGGEPDISLDVVDRDEHLFAQLAMARI